MVHEPMNSLLPLKQPGMMPTMKGENDVVQDEMLFLSHTGWAMPARPLLSWDVAALARWKAA